MCIYTHIFIPLPIFIHLLCVVKHKSRKRMRSTSPTPSASPWWFDRAFFTGEGEVFPGAFNLDVED